MSESDDRVALALQLLEERVEKAALEDKKRITLENLAMWAQVMREKGLDPTKH